MVKNVVYFERRFPNILEDVRKYLSDNNDYKLDGDRVLNEMPPEVIVKLWLRYKKQIEKETKNIFNYYKSVLKLIKTTDAHLFKEC